jgi:hypothetical protein
MTLPIYRLPVPTTTQIGSVRVVIDRNQQVYVAGSRVVSAAPSGDFMVLTLADEQVYYVKSIEYQALLAAKKQPDKPGRSRR